MGLWLTLAVNSIALGGLLFLLSAGFSLIFGLMRIPNLMHGSFFMLGAYVGVTLMLPAVGANFWIATLGSGVAIALIGGTVERFPPSLFLRETALTSADAKIADFAAACRDATGDDALKALHLMLERLNKDMAFDTDPTHAATTAAEAFALKRGVCQDITHVFIAATRCLGIPARYVGGYFFRGDGITEQEAGHAWAEACVPELGWVAFDAANGICGTDAHVRVAVGLDYLGAAPLRGARYGGRGEALSVKVHVTQAAQQAQD